MSGLRRPCPLTANPSSNNLIIKNKQNNQKFKKGVKKMAAARARADTEAERSCCGTGEGAVTCRLEGLVSVDERGQMVLPKELRERAGIAAGEKLALVSWEREGECCCLALIKAQGVAEMVRERLEPLFAPVRGARSGARGA